MILLDDIVLSSQEQALLNEAAQTPFSAELQTAEHTRELSQSQGLDYATTWLFQHLTDPDQHGTFISEVNKISPCSGSSSDVSIAIVPGAFYREDPQSGANGSQVIEVAKQWHMPVSHAPIPSFGSITESAGILLQWLKALPNDAILVSLCKGTAEVKLALAREPKAFEKVIAWVSLSGLFYGTAIVQWLGSQWWRWPIIRAFAWLRGYHYPAIWQLEQKPGSLLDFDLELPPGLPLIHVVGFPLQQHLSSPLTRRGHRRLAPQGPNDGGAILLTDLLRWPGSIYPVWGADHYLRPKWNISSLISRLIHYVLKRTGK